MAESHGNSVAAYVGVAIILIASALICLGIMFNSAMLWVPGVIGLLVGVVAWIALDKAGYGVKQHHDSEPNNVTRAVR